MARGPIWPAKESSRNRPAPTTTPHGCSGVPSRMSRAHWRKRIPGGTRGNTATARLPTIRKGMPPSLLPHHAPAQARDKPTEPPSRGNADASPSRSDSARPTGKTEPPPVRQPSSTDRRSSQRSRLTQRALSRRDEAGLRAVYPSVPREVIDGWSKKDSGVRFSSVRIIHTREEIRRHSDARRGSSARSSTTSSAERRTVRERSWSSQQRGDRFIENRRDDWDVGRQPQALQRAQLRPKLNVGLVTCRPATVVGNTVKTEASS